MTSPSQVVFAGTSDFACPSLRALACDPSFEITRIITQPNRPAGRGKRMTAPPVKDLASQMKLTVMQPRDVNNGMRGISNANRCDFLVVVAYGQILSKELLDWPDIASVNVHASLLPRFRGASPIQHAILSGDKVTGVTIQRLVQRVDAGPIIAQERMPIEERETASGLSEKLARMGADLLMRTLKRIRNRELRMEGIIQDESQATYCGKLTREMGDCDPQAMTAEYIDRKVRALFPWPGVIMEFPSTCRGDVHNAPSIGAGTKSKPQIVKLLETSLVPHPDAIELPCAKETTLYIVKLQSPGRRVTTGIEWKRGR